MSVDKILKLIDYPTNLIPINAEQIVEIMVGKKTHGYSLLDKLDAALGCSAGFFEAVKKAIQDERKASNECYRSNTPKAHAEARLDRLQYITDSTGKRTSRKF